MHGVVVCDTMCDDLIDELTLFILMF